MLYVCDLEDIEMLVNDNRIIILLKNDVVIHGWGLGWLKPGDEDIFRTFKLRSIDEGWMDLRFRRLEQISPFWWGGGWLHRPQRGCWAKRYLFRQRWGSPGWRSYDEASFWSWCKILLVSERTLEEATTCQNCQRCQRLLTMKRGIWMDRFRRQQVCVVELVRVVVVKRLRYCSTPHCLRYGSRVITVDVLFWPFRYREMQWWVERTNE